MNIITLIIIALIFLSFCIYRNTRASNYFFSISFDWLKIYEMMGITEKEYKTFYLGEDYKKLIFNNANELGQFLMDRSGVSCFEYYIIPIATRGQYKYSNIFDQQLKVFLESPNIPYTGIWKGKSEDEKDVYINCGFAKFGINKKSYFWINYNKQISSTRYLQKTIIILFDNKYLNIKNAHYRHLERIPYDVYLIVDKNNEQNYYESKIEIKKFQTHEDDFWLQMSVQSIQDAQMAPFSNDLHDYFKNEINNK